jgi:ATP-binding cassette subfamily A (ABC1) protein 3
MDEADFLGDRIAIMSRGSLRCCGSPLYLKSKYDSGYNLVINKKTSNKTSKAINDDPSVNKFMSIIQKHVQNAQLNSNINNEISFMLPKEQTPKFAALFSDLEQYKEELNIINVGVSVTTVEEVFLKIGDLEECEELDAAEESTLNNNVAILDVKTTDDFGLYAGVNAEERNDSIFFKYYQQFYGLVIKKMIHSIRYKLNVIFQLVLPIVSLLFALVLLKFGPISLKDSASLPISLKPYRSIIFLIFFYFY